MVASRLRALTVAAILIAACGASLGVRSTAASGPLFKDPWGIALDRSGDVYVTDNGAHHVVKLSPKGKVLGIWGTKGKGASRFSDPRGVATDARGNVYVADLDQNLQEFSPTGKFLRQWPTGRFIEDAAFDRHGNLYLTDGADSLLNKLSPSGRLLASWNTIDACVYVALDRAGNLYVTFAGKRIEKLSPAGKKLAVWTYSGLEGQEAQFEGIAVDPHGEVWVADSNLSRVLGLSPSGKVLDNWHDYADVSNPGQFFSPTGIAVDAAGNIYVTDSLNKRVQKLSPKRKVLAIWQ